MQSRPRVVREGGGRRHHGAGAREDVCETRRLLDVTLETAHAVQPRSRARAAGSDVLRTSARTASPRARSTVADALAELTRRAHDDDVTRFRPRVYSRIGAQFACRIPGGTTPKGVFLDICTGDWFDPCMLDVSLLHPLDPLSAEEMAAAMATLRREHPLNERTLVISITLVEPEKAIARRVPARRRNRAHGRDRAGRLRRARRAARPRSRSAMTAC